MIASRTVERSLVAATLGEDARPARFGVVTLAWSIEDPLTVRATFKFTGDPDAEWIISRDLLRAGMGSLDPAGDVDVRVRNNGRGGTLITLRSPEGVAHVLLADRDLAPFLRACHDACPAGTEDEDERLNALVGALLLAWDLA